MKTNDILKFLLLFLTFIIATDGAETGSENPEKGEGEKGKKGDEKKNGNSGDATGSKKDSASYVLNSIMSVTAIVCMLAVL